MEQTNQNHSITIDNRKSGILTGVEKVVSSSEKLLHLITTQGALVLNGNNFKIKKFSMEEGILTFEGEVDILKYMAVSDNKSVIKKLFR